MWCMKLFFSDSDCEVVEPQTFPLSRKRDSSLALESGTGAAMEV